MTTLFYKALLYNKEEFGADHSNGFLKRLNRIFDIVGYFENISKSKVFAFVQNVLSSTILQETCSLVLTEDYF